MAVKDGQEFLILNITEALADVDFTQESEVRHQLTEPNVWG
jgi:hypothetical protein